MILPNLVEVTSSLGFLYYGLQIRSMTGSGTMTMGLLLAVPCLEL